MTKRRKPASKPRRGKARPKARPATASHRGSRSKAGAAWVPAQAHHRPDAPAAMERPPIPIPDVSTYGEGTVQDTRVVFVPAEEWETLMDWMEDLRSIERFEEARREPEEAFIPYAEVKRRLWKNNIKKVRMAKGMKQKELAEALGCQPSYISKIEKPDYRPWASTLERVAGALGCDVEELI